MQDAKNRFSEVVERARSEGPQIVTRRGVETAVVLSADDFHRLTGSKPGFVDFLRSGPTLEGLDLERDQTLPRRVEL